MLDIALIRSKPDWVMEQIAKLNDASAVERIDIVVALDKERRETRTRIETAQAARNKLNRAMGKLRGNKAMAEEEKAARAQAACGAIGVAEYERASGLMDGSTDVTAVEDVDFKSAFDELIRELRLMGDEINEGFDRIQAVESQLQEHMLWLPNLPHESVPVADSEDSNVAHQPVGTFREFDFEPKPHWELGPALGTIDFERGVKLAGSRYYVLAKAGARVCSGR